MQMEGSLGKGLKRIRFDKPFSPPFSLCQKRKRSCNHFLLFLSLACAYKDAQVCKCICKYRRPSSVAIREKCVTIIVKQPTTELHTRRIGASRSSCICMPACAHVLMHETVPRSNVGLSVQEVFGHCPCKAHPVVTRGSSTELIDDDERPLLM